MVVKIDDDVFEHEIENKTERKREKKTLRYGNNQTTANCLNNGSNQRTVHSISTQYLDYKHN